MKKDNLLISFSGGETSAYMTQYLWNNFQDVYNIKIVFANTGEENEETLDFVERCSKYFGFPVTWVEALPQYAVRAYGKKNIFTSFIEKEKFLNTFYSEAFREKEFYKNKIDKETKIKEPQYRSCVEEVNIGTTYEIVNFKSASRKGEPFKRVIDKYGIPNKVYPHCTRELKLAPITKFCKDFFGRKEEYYTAVGIRVDEIDRVSKSAKKNKIVYPLASKDFMPMTKPKINFWWSQQPFRLDLKGYEGNCKFCWKKSFKKLKKIAQENPSALKFSIEMEDTKGRVGHEFKPHIFKKKNLINGEWEIEGDIKVGDYIYHPYEEDTQGDSLLVEVRKVEVLQSSPNPRTFFREYKSALQILEESKKVDIEVEDDSDVYEDVGSESCEVWSECGS